MTTTTAPEMIMNYSKEKLVELFEETEKNNDSNIFVVRGWIMDALETKMTEEEFDSFLGYDDLDELFE